MNDIEKLPRLIKQAMAALDNATTAAEVLDARDQATVAYDAAKSVARFAKAKDAHGTILAACHRMQADALTIEARAQTRLADEYDAAQGRGEINKAGKPAIIPNGNNKASVAEAGLKPKEIHEARQIRDAEKREPDIVRKTVDAKLAAGEEPTRADVKRAIKQNDAPQTNGHTDPDAIEIGRLFRRARSSYDEATQVAKGKVEINDNSDDDDDNEIAPPGVLAENILYAIGGVNENARIFNKLLKVSVLNREAVAQINLAIEGMIKKWRSLQSTLEEQNAKGRIEARKGSRVGHRNQAKQNRAAVLHSPA
jgi:hypothetical protein